MAQPKGDYDRYRFSATLTSATYAFADLSACRLQSTSTILPHLHK